MCDCVVYHDGYYCDICNPNDWDKTFDTLISHDDFTEDILNEYIPKLQTYNMSKIKRFSEIKDKKRIIQLIKLVNHYRLIGVGSFFMVYDDIDVLNTHIEYLCTPYLKKNIRGFSDEILIRKDVVVNDNLLESLIKNNRCVKLSFDNLKVVDVKLLNNYMGMIGDDIKYDISLLDKFDPNKYAILFENIMRLISNETSYDLFEPRSETIKHFIRAGDLSKNVILEYVYKYTFLLKCYVDMVSKKRWSNIYEDIDFNRFSSDEIIPILRNHSICHYNNNKISIEQYQVILSKVDKKSETYIDLFKSIKNNRMILENEKLQLTKQIINAKIIKDSVIDDYINRHNGYSKINIHEIYMFLCYNIIDNKLFALLLIHKINKYGSGNDLKELFVKNILENKPEILTEEFINKNDLKYYYEEVIKSKTTKGVN